MLDRLKRRETFGIRSSTKFRRRSRGGENKRFSLERREVRENSSSKLDYHSNPLVRVNVDSYFQNIHKWFLDICIRKYFRENLFKTFSSYKLSFQFFHSNLNIERMLEILFAYWKFPLVFSFLTHLSRSNILYMYTQVYSHDHKWNVERIFRVETSRRSLPHLLSISLFFFSFKSYLSFVDARSNGRLPLVKERRYILHARTVNLREREHEREIEKPVQK